MSDFFEQETDAEVLEEQDSGIWLSIGDLMSSLLMLFALLFIVVQVNLWFKEQELDRKEKELIRKEQELKEKTAELRKYQEAFEKLPLVILSAIRDEVGGENVAVDPETGDVSIGDRILFDEGSAELKPEGKAFLRAFIPTYSQVIFSNQDFEQQIVRVVIEGHTSSKGPDAANRALSLARSLSVGNYIFSSELNFPNKQRFLEKVVTAGRGEIDADQSKDSPSDRKVAFRFQFRREDFSDLLPSDIAGELENAEP